MSLSGSRFTSIVLALSVTIAFGCASDDADAAPAEAVPEVVPSAESSTDSTAGAGFASPESDDFADSPPDELRLSPIEQALGFDVDPERIAASEREYQIEVAEATTACVAADGFDGFTDVPDTLPTAADYAEVTPTSSVGRDGYGPAISLRALAAQVQGDFTQLGTGDMISQQHRSWETYDPIVTYFDERPDVDEEAFISAYSACLDRAWADVSPPEASLSEEIDAELSEVVRQSERSPEAVEAWDDWSRCMEDSGRSYPNRVSLREAVEAEAAPLRQQLVVLLEEAETAPLDAELQAEIEDLALEEQQLAEVDVACAATVDLDERLWEARSEAEEVWLAANADRIAIVRGESGSGGG